MWFIFGIVGVILWIFLAFWPARIAARKGRSFIGFFILSLFFWFITLFWVYAMPDKSGRSDLSGSAEQ